MLKELQWRFFEKVGIFRLNASFLKHMPKFLVSELICINPPDNNIHLLTTPFQFIRPNIHIDRPTLIPEKPRHFLNQ